MENLLKLQQNSFMPQGNEWANLANLFRMNSQQQTQQPDTMNVGGRNLLVNRQGPNYDAIAGGIQNLAGAYQGMQQQRAQQQKQQAFLQGVQGITKSQKTPDEKINDLVGLMAQHGTDYGLGVESIVKAYGEQAQRGMPKEWKPTTRQEAFDLASAKAEAKGLSPTLQKAKDARAEKIITTFEENRVKKDLISQARAAAQNIDGGIYGKIQRGFAKNLNPNDPVLQDWQKIKMVLTDAQLMNTAKTKGAISDREMDLFARAAANDDIASIKAMGPVFDRLMKVLDADEKAQIQSYQRIYKEDPTQWDEIKAFSGQGPSQAQAQPAQSIPEGQTATNPKTGTRIIFRGGKWQQLK